MSNLIITTANSNADDNVIRIDPGTITKFVRPSTMRKEKEVQAGCVSFAINLHLTQVSATNQEGHTVSQGNDVEDVWLGNESNNKELGRTQESNCLSHWQDQDSVDDNAKYTIMLNSMKKDGVLMKACIKLSHGENVVTKAKTCHQFNKKYLKEEDTFSPSKQVGIFGDQHAPFPFLTVSAVYTRSNLHHKQGGSIKPFFGLMPGLLHKHPVMPQTYWGYKTQPQLGQT